MTPPKPNILSAILISLALTILISLFFGGCVNVPAGTDSSVPAQVRSKGYDLGYWTATATYNGLALIATDKTDWSRKVQIIITDIQPYLDRAKKGEITVEAALNLISASTPSASHWTSLAQSWTSLIASYGFDALQGLADATDQYIAGNPLK